MAMWAEMEGGDGGVRDSDGVRGGYQRQGSGSSEKRGGHSNWGRARGSQREHEGAVLCGCSGTWLEAGIGNFFLITKRSLSPSKDHILEHVTPSR
ncbi:unnamed protein product [Gulo gulo]|uniref:Uncharacterized protein n=1 Tax=Gulo gulo TaxID=48420 RepID=A0A9X9LCQ7_GULGU|nr:unnamed protein product [Gulo gulo]